MIVKQIIHIYQQITIITVTTRIATIANKNTSEFVSPDIT